MSRATGMRRHDRHRLRRAVLRTWRGVARRKGRASDERERADTGWTWAEASAAAASPLGASPIHMSKIQTPQPIRGTQSLLGEDADRFHAVVAAFDRVRRLYGFKRVEVPVLEPTAVFARTMGETTDVVSKEMYSFEDRSGDSVTLRPEFTAGIARAYLSRRLAAVCAAEGRDPRPRVPLRAPAEGPLPPVPPARRRDHRRRRAAGRRRGASRFGAQLLAELGIDGRDAQAQHAGRCREPRLRGATRWYEHFASAPRRPERGQPRPARQAIRCASSTARTMRDWPIADSAPVIDDFLTAEASDFFAAVTRRARRRRGRVGTRAAAGARARLLPPHRVRIRHRPARRAGHGARRRPLRRADRTARRPAHAGGRLGGGDRAAGDADRRAGCETARCRGRRRQTIGARRRRHARRAALRRAGIAAEMALRGSPRKRVRQGARSSGAVEILCRSSDRDGRIRSEPARREDRSGRSRAR